ncbi:DUF3455 domain-containing protein [Virgisporangium aliadipatigenens]|uniref:DUF3455 domain-containing protein n=1 Tax=Virgisporangium aliadipatigenens TaxID=741659 RepID=UPI0019428291|nr:DUF3455 domain-containing protein [Virgisporangium aliadipatigenens]
MTARNRKSWTKFAVVGAFAAALVAGGTTYAFADTASAQTSIPGRFSLPAGAPTPGAGFKIHSAYKVVTGVQIYTCTTQADGTGAWSGSSTPDATLLRYGTPGRIKHGAGPRWTYTRDGSTLLGQLPPAQSVPKEGTIAWLLLNVTHESAGALDPVTHISRVRTSGGVKPTTACTPGVTKDARVRYGADYVFWTAA